MANCETDEEVQNELDRMFVLDAAFDLIHLLKPHGAFSAVMGRPGTTPARRSSNSSGPIR